MPAWHKRGSEACLIACQQALSTANGQSPAQPPEPPPEDRQITSLRTPPEKCQSRKIEAVPMTCFYVLPGLPEGTIDHVFVMNLGCKDVVISLHLLAS